MTLVWLRLYLVLEALGYLFGVDKSTASRYTNSVILVGVQERLRNVFVNYITS